MSSNFLLICKKCKEDIWMGQTSNNSKSVTGFTFYLAQKEKQDELEKFLIDHIDHDLVFGAAQNYYDL